MVEGSIFQWPRCQLWKQQSWRWTTQETPGIENILAWISDKPARGQAFLGLVLTSAEGLIKEVMVVSSWGCRGHGMQGSKRETPDPKIWKSELPGIYRVSGWDHLGNSLRAEELIRAGNSLKTTFLRAQELFIPVCRKLSMPGWKLAWLSKDFLLELRIEEEMYTLWKQGRVTWEELLLHDQK